METLQVLKGPESSRTPKSEGAVEIRINSESEAVQHPDSVEQQTQPRRRRILLKAAEKIWRRKQSQKLEETALNSGLRNFKYIFENSAKPFGWLVFLDSQKRLGGEVDQATCSELGVEDTASLKVSSPIFWYSYFILIFFV